MPKFLIEASYSPEGIRGVQKEGGSGRRAAIEKIVSNMGGRVEAFYFCFGDTDVIVIVDMPDAVSMAAISMAAGASGAVRLSTRPLLTVEEIDAAVEKTVDYRAPGA